MDKSEYKNTIRILNNFGRRFIEVYKKKLKNASMDKGQLYRTINFKIKESTGDHWLVSINLEDYWKYIENGRRAGAKMPPISVIESWITKKHILPRPMSLSSGKQVIPTQKQLAFLIARHISRDGIPAKPFISQTIAQLNKEFIQQLKASITKDLKETFTTQQ